MRAFRFPLLLLALLAVCWPLDVCAQSYTTVSATTIQDGFGAPMASGVACFYPTASTGAFTIITPSGGSAVPGPFCTIVTSGAFSLSTTPNLATAAPSGLLYTLIVTKSTGVVTLTLNGLAITGSTYNLDSLIVPTPAYPAQPSAFGLGIPYYPCLFGALYTRTDASTPATSGWVCQVGISGTFWIQSGPGVPPPLSPQYVTAPQVTLMIRSQGGGVSGVAAVVPGTNVSCSPLVGGQCVGTVTVSSTGSGSSITLHTNSTLNASQADLTFTDGNGFVWSNPSLGLEKVAPDSTHYFPLITDQTAWNAKQPAGSYLTALTGDGTASGPGSATFTLTSVATAATCGDATHVAVVTFDVKGRTTACTPTAISAGGVGTVTSAALAPPTTLFAVSGSPITSAGTFTLTLTSAAQNSVWAGPASGGAGAPSYQTAPTISAANMTSIPSCATCVTSPTTGPTLGAIPILVTAGTRSYGPSQVFIDTSVGKNLTTVGVVNADTLISSANGLTPAFSGSTVQGYFANQATNGNTIGIEDYSTALGAGEYILLENGDVTTGMEIGHRSAGGASGGSGMQSPNANFIMALLNSDLYLGPESTGGHTYLQGAKGAANLLVASETGQTQSGIYLPAMATAGLLATAGSAGGEEIVLATTAQQTITINSTACVLGSSCTVSGGGGFTNPMTAVGDLILGGTAGAATRLGIGSNTFVLTSNGTTASWAAAAGFANPMTTAGDLILGGSLGSPGRLGIGSNGQVLGISGSTVQWVTASGGPGTGTPFSPAYWATTSTLGSLSSPTTGTLWWLGTSAAPRASTTGDVASLSISGTAALATSLAAGATSQIPFQTGAGTTGFSANLTWDNTNGRLLIGAPTSVAAITLAGGTTAALGISLDGADSFANLYRSAAGTVRTDSNFQINGSLTMTGGGSITNVGAVSVNGISTLHHLTFTQTTSPVASSCGGGTVATGGTDNVFSVTGITAATACTVTFNTAISKGVCTVSTNSTSVTSSINTISTSAVTFGMGLFTGTLYGTCY